MERTSTVINIPTAPPTGVSEPAYPQASAATFSLRANLQAARLSLRQAKQKIQAIQSTMTSPVAQRRLKSAAYAGAALGSGCVAIGGGVSTTLENSPISKTAGALLCIFFAAGCIASIRNLQCSLMPSPLSSGYPNSDESPGERSNSFASSVRTSSTDNESHSMHTLSDPPPRYTPPPPPYDVPLRTS